MPRRGAAFRMALATPVFVVAAGCGPATTSAGSCHPDPAVQGCNPDFVGYSCTGADRPDELANVNKIVEGTVCHGTGETLESGAAGYCCTKSTTSCAYDPRTVCADPTLFGYSCMGTSRPDAFDPNLTCQQGIRAYGLLTYCCGAAVTGSCAPRNTGVSCASGTLGFVCTGSGIPSETDLGMNQSRSEVPLICSLPSPDPTVVASSGMPAADYCCFTPSATPPGSTCLQDQTVSACSANAFPFACTGVDTPDQDYPRIVCARPGFRGESQWKLVATLYCCTFSQQP